MVRYLIDRIDYLTQGRCKRPSGSHDASGRRRANVEMVRWSEGSSKAFSEAL